MSATSQSVTPKKPLRCLVIQMARLGDTLQSLMALRAAKQLYPELEIHFVARERFAAAVKRVPWIAKVITFPSDGLLGPVLTGQKTNGQAMGDLARWIAPLISEPWDMVVNWTYSEASSYLTGLLPARVKLGYSRRRDTSFSSTDGWSNYIHAVVQGKIDQNIHLTDILTTQLLTALQIHVGEPEVDGDAPVTSKSFFSLEIGESDLPSWGDLSKKWIGIQLGAAQDSKTWSAQNWARLASLVLKRHPECNVVLLGGKEDHARAKEFSVLLGAGFEKRVLSLVGETDFDLWASVVSRCQWVFACDTSVIHLASVLGTRVMNISVGPVRWAETGPYGNGHYVVSASAFCPACKGVNGQSHVCQERVSPEAVYCVWSYGTTEWGHRRQIPLAAHFEELGWTDLVNSVRVYRSKIRSTNDGGGVYYEPLFRESLDVGAWTSMVMGHIARHWYCGWVPTLGQELSREMLEPSLLQKLRELNESSDLLAKICDEAVRTAGLLNQKSAKLRSDKVMRLGDRDELRDLGKKLMELDQLVERLGRTHAPLKAFSQMSQVLMHNLKGSNLSELGKESADCYRQLGDGVTILRDWLKHTLGLARPVAITTERPSPAKMELNP